ncbi:MAG TPA: DUF3105 domain-containing protein [Nocardioides sp.]|nr:DUF3105 domain-containing protein [Nocardioides sp.]
MSESLPSEPEPERSRRRLPVVLAAVAAVLVLALAVTVPVLARQVSGDESSGPANLDAVQFFKDVDNGHTERDVDYEQVPPIGGPHDPAWLDCGRYDDPVRDENAVHDLEHGSIWITYDPDLAADDVDTLESVLPDNAILSPYDGLPAPVVVTVWARQLQLTGVDDPRLEMFLETYADGRTSPEPFASCAGGVSEPDGGNTTQV